MDKYFINLSDNKVDISYIDDTTTGYGKLYISNENESYSYNGYIKNGLLDKFGLIMYQYNKLNPTIIKYEGELSNNAYNGKGTLTYSNGDVFIGHFKNNLKHGNGKLFNSDGCIIFDNIWKNDIICDKIKYIEYYSGTYNIKIEGTLLNSSKVGPWIYYRKDNIIDRIEFYTEFETIEEKIVETLESFINTNKKGYIVSQKLDIKTEQTNYDLIKHNIYCKDILSLSTTTLDIKYLKTISIPTNDKLIEPNYYLQLDDKGKIKIISYVKTDLLNLIIFLSNNKFIIKNNDKMSLYQLINNKLSLYYEGDLDKQNKPTNYGIMYNNGLIKYKGTFKNGRITNGSLYSTTTPQYIMYEGIFVINTPNVSGTYYNERNIKIYEGMVSSNKYNGIGISYWETTGLKNWEGEWRYGIKHGDGYLYDENGGLICHCKFDNNNIVTIY